MEVFPFVKFKKTKNNDVILYLDAGSTLNPNGVKRLQEYFDTLYHSDKSFLRFDIGLEENIGLLKRFLNILI